MSFEILRDYFKEIRKIPVLTAEAEKKIAISAQKGNEESRILLIRSNLRLVVKIARRYERLGMSISDLIEEGNIGLMKALSRYNPRLGFRFSTYASWWIRQHVIRAIANQARVVRLPVYMSELLHKMRKEQERLTHKYSRKPTNDELAKALKIPISKVMELHKAANRATSLDRKVSEDGEVDFIDLLQDDEIEAVDELVNLFKKEEVDALLALMGERERNIIDLRFGLKSGLPKTLAEVAKSFHITRERVRQIEKEALMKMRRIITSGVPLTKVDKKEDEKAVQDKIKPIEKIRKKRAMLYIKKTKKKNIKKKTKKRVNNKKKKGQLRRKK